MKCGFCVRRDAVQGCCPFLLMWVMASISSFPQDTLCCFFPIGLRILWRSCNVFKLIFDCKLLKLATVKLWSVVHSDTFRKPISCKVRLQFVYDPSCSLGLQYIQLKEIRVTVSGYEIVSAIEFKQVCRDALPWSCRFLVTY